MQKLLQSQPGVQKKDLNESEVVLEMENNEALAGNTAGLTDADQQQNKESSKTEQHTSKQGPVQPRRAESVFKNPAMAEMDIQEQNIANNKALQMKRQGSVLEAGGGQDDWHKMSQYQLFHKLKTSEKGLTTEEHALNLTKYGKNEITPPKETPAWLRLLKKMGGGFQYMMWVGAILCFIVYGLSKGEDKQILGLGIVLILVVVLTSIFEFYQEGKSGQVMAALKKLAPTEVNVMRDGKLVKVDAKLLVPGDIVQVVSGEKVPADVRVLESSDLKVNNASLTGENVDIKLGPKANAETLYEAKNVARMGCNFTSGKATCVVFATGDGTFFGTIAKSTLTIKRPPTQMKLEILRLIKIMAIFATILGVIFFILAVASGYTVVEAIIFMIGIIVANVPEGLLPQMTVSFTLTAKRMFKVGVIVQNLEIIETLGAVNVICSDKTGTLTQNRMTVSHLVYNGKITITDQTPNMAGDNFDKYDQQDMHFKALQRVATINTDAMFLDHNVDVNKRLTKGDASETALIKFFDGVRGIEEYREKCPKHYAVPFNSTNKWMLNVISSEEDPNGNLILLFKGAPERVLGRCTHILQNGKDEKITPEIVDGCNAINEILAKRGERVLAFAQMVLDKQYDKKFAFDAESHPPNFPLDKLTFIGYISLIDPPRATVKPAIHKCKKAGIQVFMVTGDHPITAHSIAKSLDLVTQPTLQELKAEGKPIPEGGAKAIVIHGTEMVDFKEEDWDRVLKHEEIVFARTMPTQKQDIVRELNKLNKIVAMTGDGVNDAPALKAANVGIAMMSGSDVAKEASQLILIHDDFGAIIQGIEEGRTTFANLKKFISYVLSSNIPELIPFLAFIILKIPLGLETIHILLIDLGTDLAPAISLAYESPESSIMEQPPRKRTEHIVSWRMMAVSYLNIGVLQTVAAFIAWYYVFSRYGFSGSSLDGSGIGFREDWKDMDGDQKDFFMDMCKDNQRYLDNYCTASDLLHEHPECCKQEFTDYRIEVLAIAQSCFLMHVTWTQVANALARKTQTQTIFTKHRLLGNKPLMYSFIFEIALIILLVYCPGLNEVLMLHQVNHGDMVVYALWMFPAIIIWEELRKAVIRWRPEGIIAKITAF